MPRKCNICRIVRLSSPDGNHYRRDLNSFDFLALKWYKRFWLIFQYHPFKWSVCGSCCRGKNSIWDFYLLCWIVYTYPLGYRHVFSQVPVSICFRRILATNLHWRGVNSEFLNFHTKTKNSYLCIMLGYAFPHSISSFDLDGIELWFVIVVMWTQCYLVMWTQIASTSIDWTTFIFCVDTTHFQELQSPFDIGEFLLWIIITAL